jgi:hypothetical protein
MHLTADGIANILTEKFRRIIALPRRLHMYNFVAKKQNGDGASDLYSKGTPVL